MNGLILINKPKGITSFKAVLVIRKKMGNSRAGHTGTLDMFAQGLLLILTGRYTKLAPLFSKLDKEYHVVVCFGKETDTLDPQGEVVKTGIVPSFSCIREALSLFHGKIRQVPPQFSAVHIKGRRAYHFAREGRTVALKAREVEIYNISIGSYNPPLLELNVSCSTGTYIRSLARDIARHIGTCAYLTYLNRVRIGNFSIANAISLDQFTKEEHVLGPVQFLENLPMVNKTIVKQKYIEKILYGSKIKKDFLQDPHIKNGIHAIFSQKKKLIAIVNKQGDKFQYRMVVGNRL